MRIRRAVVLAAVSFAPIIAQADAPFSTAYTLDCIHDDMSGSCGTFLESATFSSLDATTVVFVKGQNAPGDGGGGWFYYDPNGCDLDYGTRLHDQAGNCFRRRFTGTVYATWFGVKGSSVTFGLVPKNDVGQACGGSSCWPYMFDAAALAPGNRTVSTGGMYLYSSATVNPHPGQTFTCGAPFTQEEQKSDYSNSDAQNPVVGAIVFPHGVIPLHFTERANEFHHCLVLTNGQVGMGHPEINLAPANCTGSACAQRKALKNDANVVANSDTGVFCDGPDATYIHEVTVIGFDTGIASFGCSHFRVDNVNVDAPVPIYLQSNKSPAFINHVRGYSMLSAGIPNPLTKFYVTGIAKHSPSDHSCDVTIYSSGDPGIQAGDWVSLAGDNNFAHEGVLSCYGSFKAGAVTPGAGNTYTINFPGTLYGDATPLSGPPAPPGC